MYLYQNLVLEYKMVRFQNHKRNKILRKGPSPQKKFWNKLNITPPFILVRNRVIPIEKSSHDTNRNRNHKYPTKESKTILLWQ